MGGGGQRVLDKEGREEGRVKRRTNEKHPCRKVLSHLPQQSVSTTPLLSLSVSLSRFLSSQKLFPTEERKTRKALWFHLEWGGFFTEESMATTTRKKSIREEEHFLSAHTSGLVPFMLLGKVESQPWVTAFAIFPPSCPALPSFTALQWREKDPICYSVISLQPASHHINKELSGVPHCHTQGLAWRSELRGHRGELSAGWGARCSSRQMWGLWGQAGGAVDEARPVGYRVGMGTAVADRASDTSLTRGSQRALTWCPVAPDLRFAATATRLATFVLATVWTAASCGHTRRENDYYPRLMYNQVQFFLIKSAWPTWASLSHLGATDVTQTILTQLVGDAQEESFVTNAQTVREKSLPSQAKRLSHYRRQLHVLILLPQTASLLWQQVLQNDDFKTLGICTSKRNLLYCSGCLFQHMTSNPQTDEKICTS